MRVRDDVHVRLGRRMGALVSDSPRPEDPHPNPLPRGEGGRAAAALRTPGVYKSLRRRRAGVPARVAGEVARLLGPAATLTPTLSLKGDRCITCGWLPGRPLVYSPGEGKNGGGEGGGVVGSGLGRDSGLSTLTPGSRPGQALALSLPGRGNKTASPLRGRGVVQRSLKGEGGRGAPPLIDGAGRESGLGFNGRFDRKTPHPRIVSGAGSNPLPRGEGEEQPEVFDEGSWGA